MSINIKFPFNDSGRGFFLDMSDDTDSAIKNNLIHLLLTNKKERYYNPNFGSNLRKYIFEPDDSITHAQIQSELNDTIKEHIPNLIIKNLAIDYDSSKEYFATVRIEYVYTEGVFESKDFVVLNF